MEKLLARVVNKGFAGEPEYIVIQELSTNKMFELSQIVEVKESNGDISRVSLENDNLNQDLIQRILSQGHTVDITWNENDEVTLHF